MRGVTSDQRKERKKEFHKPVKTFCSQNTIQNRGIIALFRKIPLFAFFQKLDEPIVMTLMSVCYIWSQSQQGISLVYSIKTQGKQLAWFCPKFNNIVPTTFKAHYLTRCCNPYSKRNVKTTYCGFYWELLDGTFSWQTAAGCSDFLESLQVANLMVTNGMQASDKQHVTPCKNHNLLSLHL